MALLKQEINLENSKFRVSSIKHSEIPRNYQEDAIKSILKIFKKHNRTHIVMACGTGKTRVGLWIAERMKARRIVVFAPSLALISQLMHEWFAVTKWAKVSCLAVCSDETVTKGMDSFVLNPEDCDFPVTTDAKLVRKFLKEKSKLGLCFAPIILQQF